MNILFIYTCSLDEPFYKRIPPKPLYSELEIHMGISYISSVLKHKNHVTDLFVYTKYTKEEDLDNCINEFKPSLICFTAVFREFKTICSIANHIKTAYSSVLLLAGGPHVSLNPEDAIKENFDFICVGEGEYPISELTERLDTGSEIRGIKNLWIKTENGVEKNITRPFIQALDELPFPDRTMWQKWIFVKSIHSILLGRGCPYDCTYCCNHALRNISNGKYVRLRSPGNIIAEIDELVNQFPDITNIQLEVEAINLDINFLNAFCRKLKEYNKTLDKKITYCANFRIIPSQDISTIFEQLYKANITKLNIGLESGNERIRKEVMKRNYSNQDVVNIVNVAKKFGFSIMLYIMLGLPTETETEFLETLRLTEECNPNIIQLSIFCPYPGTELYEYCIKNNIIKGEVMDMGRNTACVDLPGFSKEQIQRLCDDFNKRYGPIPFQVMKKPSPVKLDG